jgi:hypothetical protein
LAVEFPWVKIVCGRAAVSAFGLAPLGLADAVTFQGHAVAFVGDTIQNGVGIGWVTDHDAPFVDRQLAGDDQAGAARTLFEHLQHIFAPLGVERRQAKVVTV